MFGLNLLDGIAVIYLLIGVWTAFSAWRERASLTDDTLTTRDRYLLGQLAFFVLVPPGVLLHEVGHALATLQVGGQVVGFHYALFYGYVVPQGNFTPLEEWWIALSGNLVSILYGLAAIPLIPRVQAKWLKYLLLAFVRVQLTWALIGYPLLTLLGFGDWQTIYSPQTWQVGVPFGILHLALIVALYLVNRSPRLRIWEASLFAETASNLQVVRQAPAGLRQDHKARMERGKALADAQLPDLAKAHFQEVLKENPHDPVALYRVARIEYDARDIPAARRHFRESLQVSTNNPNLAAENHFYLGLIYAEQGRFSAAVQEYDTALGLYPDQANYHYWRGMAWRALGDRNLAVGDFDRAARLFETISPEWSERARQMASEKS